MNALMSIHLREVKQIFKSENHKKRSENNDL